MLHHYRSRAACAILALSMLMAASPAAPAAAQGAGLRYGLFLQPDTAQLDGQVTALAQDGDTLYLGGTFSYIGPPTGGLALIDPATGTAVAGMPLVSGTVAAIEADGVGGWFIGGSFDRVGELPRRNLAHIRADRSVDPAWVPDPGWPVSQLALANGRLYAGGGLDSSRFVGLQAFDAASGRPAPWNPPPLNWWLSNSGTHGWVDRLIAAGDAIVVSGSYNVAGSGEYCCQALILDALTGAQRPRPAELEAGFQPLAAGGEMLYLLAGSDIRALDTATGELKPWRVPVVGTIYDAAMAADGSTLYLAGSMSQVCGQATTGLGAIDVVHGRAQLWAPHVGSLFYSIAVRDTTVYAAGTAPGATRPLLATIDGRTGAGSTHLLLLNNEIAVLDSSGGALLAGGYFSSAGGTPREGLAAIDLATGLATGWAPPGMSGSIWALAAGGGAVYVGGEFIGPGAQPRMNLAALDTSTGATLPWDPGASGAVRTLALSGTTLFAGGAFTRIGGRDQPYLAALDTATGQATGWSPLLPSPVTGVAASGDTVYAASGERVIAFDALTGQQRWSAAPEGFTAGGPLVVSGGSVYAVSLHSLFALDAASGAPRFTMRAWRSVATLHDIVYTAGFGTPGQVYWRDTLRAYDPASGRELALIEADGYVLTLLAAGDTLVAGGTFRQIGGEPRHSLAVFRQVELPYQTGLALVSN